MNERAPATTAPPLEHGSSAEQDAFSDLVGRELSDVNERGDQIINSFEQDYDVSNSPEQSAEIETPSTVVGEAIERISALPSPEDHARTAETNGIINGEVVDVSYDDEQNPSAKVEAAKITITETGHAALEAAKGTAEASPSITALGEATDETSAADSSTRLGIARRVVDDIKTIANSAYARFNLRAMEARGLVPKADRAGSDEQQVATPESAQATIEAKVDAYRRLLEQEHAAKSHEEAQAMNEEYDLEDEAYARNEAFDTRKPMGKRERMERARRNRTTEDQSSDKGYDNLTDYQKYREKASHEAMLKAQAAIEAKARRQQARQEVYNSLSDAAKEHLDQLRSKVKKGFIGRTLRFFARHGRKMKAAFGAYRSTK